MSTKLTLEEFLAKKEELMTIYKEFEQKFDFLEQEDETFIENFISEYYPKQVELLSYDLSDIPFDAWEGLLIYSDETRIADFSKTHANIDFHKIEFDKYGDFRGCNLRNINRSQHIVVDESVKKDNPNLFFSDDFPKDFINKYYDYNLTLEDILILSEEQQNELKGRNVEGHINPLVSDYNIIKILGYDKTLEFYKYNKEEFEIVRELIDGIYYQDLESLLNVPFDEIKTNIFNYYRNRLLTDSGKIIEEHYPKAFVLAHPDLFLIDKDIPENIKRKYFARDLTIEEYLEYAEVFKDIPIDNFISERNFFINHQIQRVFGEGQFQKIAAKYKSIFKMVYNLDKFSYYFENVLPKGKNIEDTFLDAIKEFYVKRLFNTKSENEKELAEEIQRTFDFRVIKSISTVEELLNCDKKTIIINDIYREFIDSLGIDNLKRFEEETHFFSGAVKNNHNDEGTEMHMLYLITHPSLNVSITNQNKLLNGNAYQDFIRNLFKNGNLSYEEFKEKFAVLLNILRKEELFFSFNYDFLDGKFREQHPNIFIDKEAPEELRNMFYGGKLTLKTLKMHPEYYSYLMNYDLKELLITNIVLEVSELNDGGFIKISYQDFVEEFCKRYGNEKFFALVNKYGDFLNTRISSLNGEIENEERIYRQIRTSIYGNIVSMSNNPDYYDLINVEEFKREYPELFIDLTNISTIEKEELRTLEKSFYEGTMEYEDIKKHPELIPYLKNKNLFVAFKKHNGKKVNNRITLGGMFNNSMHSDLELLEFLGNKHFLELCREYGKYLNGTVNGINAFVKIIDEKYYSVSDESELSFEEIKKLIENHIYKEMFLGNLRYNEKDAPEFLKKDHPELFLDENASTELKDYFYLYGLGLSFEALSKHRDGKKWLGYLKGKAITPFLRNCPYKQEMIKYFETFGEEDAYKLGISKPKTVEEMLRCHQTSLMKIWYDKTGKKFIPDYIVMQNFSVEEIDKFLSSGKQWSNLMKIERYASSPDTRDALLKIAYTFGTFDNDLSGIKKLDELLNGIPRKLNEEQVRLLKDFEKSLSTYNVSFNKTEEYNIILRELNEKEKVNKGEVFSKIYHFHEDGTATLKINPQENKKIRESLRIIMEQYGIVLNPHEAHIYFGGFALKYDKDFREFFLKYYDVIMSNPDYTKYLPSIQKQFGLIKTFNSNRTLTLDLAVSFVTSNKYIGVEPGNEKVADLSTKVGYSQKDFETLQQIYNYGKLRTFSSIPRIENKTEKYSYELLRLDDPHALVIGPETDCCQSLGQAAEVCMEHSMVSNDGRVFIIKDNDGNIIAQSWVWRNKGVLCFDNIEIPNKAFERFAKTNHGLDNSDLANEVFLIYKKAAEEIMEQDDIIYRELLECGKITEEQYKGLRISKITIGKGYNDIASALQENLEIDKEEASFPKEFVPPVDLTRSLYVSDSRTQYVLNERPDRIKINQEALYVHKDKYKEYTDKDFTISDLLILEKLEIITKGNLERLNDLLDSGYYLSNNTYTDLVSRISNSYGLNSEYTRIVMNANFAIIFEKRDNTILIGDLLFNREMLNKHSKTIMLQIKLAIEQISEGKEIDISLLNEEQTEFYIKCLEEEIDMNRGESFGRK